MQVTRQRIIDLLRTLGQASVETLAQRVGLTPMAVRHHLNVLQADDLIEVSHTKRQHRPGRPIQMYSLTNKARKLYPQEYFQLTSMLVKEIARQMGPKAITNLFNGIADRFLAEIPPTTDEYSIEQRLDTLVTFLREKGFIVEWRVENGQYVVYHFDCPYRQFAQRHQEVCQLDKKVISTVLNTTPMRVSCIAFNDDRCKYVLTDVVAPAATQEGETTA